MLVIPSPTTRVMTAMKPTCKSVSKAKPRLLMTWRATASGNTKPTRTTPKALATNPLTAWRLLAWNLPTTVPSIMAVTTVQCTTLKAGPICCQFRGGTPIPGPTTLWLAVLTVSQPIVTVISLVWSKAGTLPCSIRGRMKAVQITRKGPKMVTTASASRTVTATACPPHLTSPMWFRN